MANNFLSSFAKDIRKDENQNNGLARVARWLTDEQGDQVGSDTPNGVRHSTLAFPLRQQEGIRSSILDDEHYYSEKPIMGNDDSNFSSALMALLSDKPGIYDNNGYDAIVKAFQNGAVNTELASLLLGAKGCISGNDRETEQLESEPPLDSKSDDEKQPQGNSNSKSCRYSNLIYRYDEKQDVVTATDLLGKDRPVSNPAFIKAFCGWRKTI
jgi:hypothetical protein